MKRTALLLGGIGAGIGFVFAACSLDLDESLIAGSDAGSDVSTGGASGSGGAAGSGGSGGTGGKIVDSGPACDADPQCTIDGGCIEGRCASNTCVYEICPVENSCEARSCDTATGVCSAPQSYGFKATSIDLDSDVGCSGQASRCVAGMDDYVFVGTDAGILAWRVLSPANPEPITVQQPAFGVAINRVVATEKAVVFIGPLSSGKLSVAWVNLPADPLATQLPIQTAQVSLSDSYSYAYPGGESSFFLVLNDPNAPFPAAHLDLPLTNNQDVTLYPASGLGTGNNVVAASGSTLVFYRTDTTTAQVPTFSLETSAGTSNAQFNGEQADAALTVPTSLSAHNFTSAYDGSVLWSTSNLVAADGGGLEADAVMLRWPITGTSTTVDTSIEVKVEEGYTPTGQNAALAGPSALIDGSTAIVTAAYPADTSQTRVRSVTRSGSTLTVGSKASVLTFPISQIGVSASRRFGFVLTPSSQNPTLKAALHVFAPGC